MLDVTVRHPDHDKFLPAWRLMRDAFNGEDDIKRAGETYLPMKTGIATIADAARRTAAYSQYMTRAEFPDLVALTVRGALGTILGTPAVIELPPTMEPLRVKATRDGLSLEALHRLIASEVMLTGRYGLLPGLRPNGTPYLAGYTAETIINWDMDDDKNLSFLVLDETAVARNPVTGAWEKVETYRECGLDGGRFASRVWQAVMGAPGTAAKEWRATDPVEAADPRGRALPFIPFVFVNTADTRPAPDDVPLYGLAKIALRIYRMDADYTTSLHMTAEPTPVVSGYDDPKMAIEDGIVPNGIGASSMWVLPVGGGAQFLEFTGAGIQKQEDAIARAYERAVIFGAQLLADQGAANESGEAKRVRLDAQHSTLKGIAQTTAAALEQALKNVAVWMGANPDAVKVTPNLDFFDHTLTPQDIAGIVGGWQAGAYSWRTVFDRLQKGGVIPDDRAPEEEIDLLAQDPKDRADAQDQIEALPPREPAGEAGANP